MNIISLHINLLARNSHQNILIELEGVPLLVKLIFLPHELYKVIRIPKKKKKKCVIYMGMFEVRWCGLILKQVTLVHLSVEHNRVQKQA